MIAFDNSRSGDEAYVIRYRFSHYVSKMFEGIGEHYKHTIVEDIYNNHIIRLDGSRYSDEQLANYVEITGCNGYEIILKSYCAKHKILNYGVNEIDMPIKDIEMSRRLREAFSYNRIDNLNQIKDNCLFSFLCITPNFGKTGIIELLNLTNKHKLFFKEDV
jgi:hypothetical protein